MTKIQLFRCIVLIALSLNAELVNAQKSKTCDIDFLPGLWARVSITREMPADTAIQRFKKIKVDSTFYTWDIQRDFTVYQSGLPYGRILKTQITFFPNTCKFNFGKELKKDPFRVKEILEVGRKVLLVKAFNPKGAPEYIYFIRMDFR